MQSVSSSRNATACTERQRSPASELPKLGALQNPPKLRAREYIFIKFRLFERDYTAPRQDTDMQPNA
jgi:hypothetical protein